MTFKKFVSYCSDRAADGQWTLTEYVVTSDIIRRVQAAPFWKRRKAWKEISSEYPPEKIIAEIESHRNGT